MRFVTLLTAAAGILSCVGAAPVVQQGSIDVRANRVNDGNKESKTAAAANNAKANTKTAVANTKTAATAGNTKATTEAATATAAQAATSAAGGAVNIGTAAAASQVAQLKVAGTHLDKLNILSQDSDFKFDFNTAKQGAQGAGGFITTANMATMPATILTDSSMAIGILGPCGFATPHSHPRASELNLIIEGTLQSSMTLENSARNMNQTLTKLQMTIFPQGSMHMEINPDCSNATFVAAFTNNDAGVQQTAQTFMEFGDQIIGSALGGSVTLDGVDIDAFRGRIPVNVARGVDACLVKCGLKKRSVEETKVVMRRSGLIS